MWTSVVTEHHKNGKWVWSNSFRPVYEWRVEQLVLWEVRLTPRFWYKMVILPGAMHRQFMLCEGVMLLRGFTFYHFPQNC